VFNGEGCVCRHEIVREVVLSSLSPITRRVLHLRAAKVLYGASRPNADPVLLHECGKLLIDSGDRTRGARGALWLARRLLRLGAARRVVDLATKAAAIGEAESVHRAALSLRMRALRLQGDWAAIDATFEAERVTVDNLLSSSPHSDLELLAIDRT